MSNTWKDQGNPRKSAKLDWRTMRHIGERFREQLDKRDRPFVNDANNMAVKVKAP